MPTRNDDQQLRAFERFCCRCGGDQGWTEEGWCNVCWEPQIKPPKALLDHVAALETALQAYWRVYQHARLEGECAVVQSHIAAVLAGEALSPDVERNQQDDLGDRPAFEA